MQKNATYLPNEKSQRKIIDMINKQRVHSLGFWQRREFLESIDKSYFGNVDTTEYGRKAKQAVNNGDIDKFINVVVPVVMPHVESAVAFQNSIFLQGYPLFATAAPAKFLSAARQMDAVIEDQQTHFGWINEFQQTFRSLFKYNLGAMHASWETERLFSPEGGEEAVYAGNKLEWMDPYNTYWDPTVKPSKASSEGEYAGFTKILSTINLMRYLQKFNGVFNLKKALDSLGKISNLNASYYVPAINANTFVDPNTIGTTNWNTWFNHNHSNQDKNSPTKAMTFGMHQVTVAYAWIIPSHFGMSRGLENPNSVQIWRFILVNDDVLVQAERMNNAHSQLPIVVAQGMEDGLGYQTKSLAQNVLPIQQITTAIFNGGVHARKRALSGTVFYDPKRVSKADLEDPTRNKAVQVKRDSYNSESGIASAIHTLQFDDGVFQQDQQDLNSALSMADQVTGRNPARQGQFVKGNKTREEFSTIMGNSEGRDITTSMSIEGSLMQPIKAIIKANILQYQDMRSLYNTRQDEMVEVKPEVLRNANLTFKLADGLLPAAKMISSEALSVAFQTMQSVPELGQAYNAPGIFAYLMETQGANIAQFQKPEEMVAYEQAMIQWQQAVGMVAAQMQTMKDITMEQVEEMMQKLPPQPTPEQFGWNPAKQLKDVDQGSVSSTFLKALMNGQPAEGEPNQMQAM